MTSFNPGVVEYIENAYEHHVSCVEPNWQLARFMHWNTDGTVCLQPKDGRWIIARQEEIRATDKTIEDVSK